MAVGAVQEPKENPILLRQKLALAERREKAEANEKEVLVFAQQTETAKTAATAPVKVKPVVEHVTAVAGSLQTTPLFEYANKTKSEYNANQALFNFENSVASSKLTKPSGSHSSGDKKDQGNQFTSAHKSIEDLRYEKLLEGDIEDIEII